MKILNFSKYRSWITCGSYALLNIIDAEIDLLRLENSTGVTFGISSFEAQFYFTRMITPFTCFWDGVNTIKKICGITIKRMIYEDKKELIDYIESSLSNKFIIGPLNMMKLVYLPLCTQYKLSDHYIALHKDNNNYYVIDSEGIIKLRVSLEDLKRIIDVSGIPEADNKYNIGIIEGIDTINDEDYITLETIKLAKQNIINAEENNQGGSAILRCLNIIKDTDINRWQTPLHYDLGYLMQRKYMFLAADTNKQFISNDLEDSIYKQIYLLSELRESIRTENMKMINTQMDDLSKYEKYIYEQCKEMIL